MKKARKFVKKLDLLWSEKTKKVWREKYGLICVWCKTREWSQSDHIVNRWKFSTRWDLRNCICLCVDCHLFQKQTRLIEWRELVIKTIGRTVYDELVAKGNSPDKVNINEVEKELKCA